jgi:hypothetical protein
MSVGMRTYQRIKNAEARANDLGMSFKSHPWGGGGEVFNLMPSCDQLPAINSESILFIGDLDQLETFLGGVEWARKYDRLLGLKTDQRRLKSEQKIRNRRLLNQLRQTSEEHQ